MKATDRFFDGYACSFDALYGDGQSLLDRVLINPLFRKSMRLRFERTLQACAPAAGRSFLDIGCGPGHYAIRLAELGARRVLGLDFSPAMIELARQRAVDAGVAERCEFAVRDFAAWTGGERFDCAVVMGVMDYIEDAAQFVAQVRAATVDTAFFSFPADGGLLAWQRKLRYRDRCALYMYTEAQIQAIFGGTAHRIERLARDFFVTAPAAHAKHTVN